MGLIDMVNKLPLIFISIGIILVAIGAFSDLDKVMMGGIIVLIVSLFMIPIWHCMNDKR